jgi:hypothetical protein
MKMMNVFESSHEELIEDIIDAYETREPLYIWGRTGIGKSYTVRKAAKILAEKYNRKLSESIRDADSEHFLLLDRRMALRDPTDLIGVLYKDNGVSKWHYPDWLYRISKDHEEERGFEIRGIVFLDELNLAPPLTQNAAYSLILDRKLEDLEIADGIAMIAAGNVEEDKAHTFDLADPLKTRFTHVTLAVPVFKDDDRRGGWFYWAVNNGIDSRILAFLSFQPDKLFHYVEGDRTFPTPRGWEKASKLMKGKQNGEAWRAVAKACGYISGLQFKQFMELSNAVDVEEILKNPWTFTKLEISQKFSVIGSIVHLYSQNPEKYAEMLFRFAAQIFTGIYDDAKLAEYLSLKNMLEDKMLNKEERERITAKAKQMEGNKMAEFAMLTLSSMKAVNKEFFASAFHRSRYASAVTDMLVYLLPSSAW